MGMPESELDVLKAKLAKREGTPGFAENVAQLKERIAELERGGATQKEGN